MFLILKKKIFCTTRNVSIKSLYNILKNSPAVGPKDLGWIWEGELGVEIPEDMWKKI